MRIPLLQNRDWEIKNSSSLQHSGTDIPAVAPGVHQLAQLGVHEEGVDVGVVVVVPSGGGGAELLESPRRPPGRREEHLDNSHPPDRPRPVHPRVVPPRRPHLAGEGRVR